MEGQAKATIAFIVKIDIKALPAFSILVGEAKVNYMLGHVVILPSPIGVELMEFPAKMMDALQSIASSLKHHSSDRPSSKNCASSALLSNWKCLIRPSTEASSSLGWLYFCDWL